MRRTIALVLLLVALATAVFFLGWSVRTLAYQSTPKQTQQAPVEEPKPEFADGRLIVRKGDLEQCHAELSEFQLKITAYIDGKPVMQSSEVFRVHLSDGFTRQYRPIRFRAVGPEGEFAAAHRIWRAFPNAVEFGLYWEKFDGPKSLVVKHRFFAQIGNEGSAALENNVVLKWTFLPIDPAQATKEAEEQFK